MQKIHWRTIYSWHLERCAFQLSHLKIVLEEDFLIMKISFQWNKSKQKTNQWTQMDPWTSSKFKNGTREPLRFKSRTKFKSGTPGSLSKFKSWTHIMLFFSLFFLLYFTGKTVKLFYGYNFPRKVSKPYPLLWTLFTISFKTLSFTLEFMSHSVCLIQSKLE